jgi:hypothetical protein
MTTCLSLSVLQSNTSTQIKQRSPTFGKYCYLNSDCGKNELCVDFSCECKANFKSNGLICTYVGCKYDSDCQAYDPNRQCVSGSCNCKNFYSPEYYSQKCETQCTYNSECGFAQFCYLGSCICKQGYKRNAYGSCVSLYCYKNSDCWYNFHDYYSYCSWGSCVCNNHYYLDSVTQMCRYSGVNAWVWAWIFFFIPICVIICFIYYLRRRRAHYHHHSSHSTVTVIGY